MRKAAAPVLRRSCSYRLDLALAQGIGGVATLSAATLSAATLRTAGGSAGAAYERAVGYTLHAGHERRVATVLSLLRVEAGLKRTWRYDLEASTSSAVAAP